jgi:hypothetical protein
VKRRNGQGLPEEVANGTSADAYPPITTAPTRITVALVARAIAALRRIVERTKLSQTDVINRAIQLYEFIDYELSTGAELIIIHRDGQRHSVKLL